MCENLVRANVSPWALRGRLAALARADIAGISVSGRRGATRRTDSMHAGRSGRVRSRYTPITVMVPLREVMQRECKYMPRRGVVMPA